MASLRTTLRSGVGSKAHQNATTSALLDFLTPIQRKFVLDPHRYKVARCSRRSGKSYMVAVYLLMECLKNPKTPVLYAGLTRDSAREAIWPIFIEILDKLNIPHKAQPSSLQITFPNGSKITIFGCDAENARNRLRGRKFKLICFDETGFYTALDALVYAVLPMLADYQGTLCLTSSPGELLEGLFYEADQGLRKESWSRYTWTIHDNPHFQKPSDDPRYKTRAEEELANVLSMVFHGNALHPGYRREWCGEWVSDHTALVYPVGPQNLIQEIYSIPYQEHAIGLHFSPFVNAIAIARYSEYSRDFQIIDAREFEDLELDAYASKLMSAIETYKPTTVVADTGVYSKNIIDELKRRYKLPVIYMDDKDLTFHQRVFANDLCAGHIKIKSDLPIVQRFAKIVKSETDGKEITGQPNYSPCAALALYRKVYNTTLAHYTAPLSEEERHIKQLEDAVHAPEELWYDRF